TGCSWSVLFYFYTQNKKKVPTTNRVSEWSSVPNILEPNFAIRRIFFGLFAGFHLFIVGGKINDDF
ncbi:hypothetical protein, partial [Weissella confusa]|uniref:hypothetical protein n=1 Tax=Weissella confusa TaxID=1583 RepID=UPI001A7E3A31